jgi:hypothetical protein
MFLSLSTLIYFLFKHYPSILPRSPTEPFVFQISPTLDVLSRIASMIHYARDVPPKSVALVPDKCHNHAVEIKEEHDKMEPQLDE